MCRHLGCPAGRATIPLMVAMAGACLFVEARAADHPSLVDPSAAKCETCHPVALAQASKHAPGLQSCLQCHHFSIDGGKTAVVLAAKTTELCVTCHKDRGDQARAKVAKPHRPVTESCTHCHNPHGGAQVKLLKAPVPDLCLRCHPSTALNGTHARPVARANCLRCHDQHGSNYASMLKSDKLHKPFAERSCPTCHRPGLGVSVKSRPPDLCYACHDQKKFSKSSVHTAVKQGKCTACHEPHVAVEANLLRSSGPKLCVSCHESIARRMQAKVSHFPTQDSCLNCHDAHASDQPSQLLEKLPALCLNCHDPDAALQKQHLGADMKKLRCTGCHDPHGSAQPQLLNSTTVHPPFAEKACEFCHDGSYKKLIQGGTKDLCYTCHTDIQELVTTSKVKHPAFEIAECTDCHTPHASLQQKLVKYPGGKVCTDCHNDKAPENGEKAHGVIDLLGCRACHEPHGGPRNFMLRVEGPDLCLGCHVASNRKPQSNGQVLLLGRFRIAATDAARIPALPIKDGRNHPVTNHRVVGTPTAEEMSRVAVDFKGSLSCFSCHNPHKGRYRLLVGDASSATEMCMRCHKK